MPFRSEKQRRYLWASHPDIAKRWAHKYPESNKNLPMYASEDKTEDKAEKSAKNRNSSAYVNERTQIISTIIHLYAPETLKYSEDATYRVKLPHSDKPTYAGQEREEGEVQDTKEKDPQIEQKKPENAINSLLQKLAVVLSQPMAQLLEDRKAIEENRQAVRQPRNPGIRRYSAPVSAIPPPMGSQAQVAASPTPTTSGQPAQPSGQGMNSPSAQPINSFGPLSGTGNINGNAAFGVKNSPDSSKVASGNNEMLAWLTSMSGPVVVDPDDLDYDERAQTSSVIKCATDKWAASFWDDYKYQFEKMFGIDPRFPTDYKTMRQLGIATGIGGVMGLARGTFWPGYHEKLDEHGNVIAKKRRSPWLGALEGAAIGAGTSALANYAGQTVSQYNPEIDKIMTGVKDKATDYVKGMGKNPTHGIDVSKMLFDRISRTA